MKGTDMQSEFIIKIPANYEFVKEMLETPNKRAALIAILEDEAGKTIKEMVEEL